ncbi:LuxR C-terminal-related transcriptional regulator [Aeoliella sp.]|uniref:helix-turn-helix domain-containing protein n=1 Tax=Aeoliella sp. TaxID=2795800 RepID=UPI003CCBB4C4
MRVDVTNPESFADTYAYVVDREGTIVLHPRYPDVVGTKPWDWAIGADKEKCREHYVQACMFREPQGPFVVSIHYSEETYPLRFHLFPLDEGQVLVYYTRVFNGDLTDRERHVLVLVAGGASANQIADALGISASTARDHIANLKRKLHIHHADGFRMAAHHFGLGK